MIKIEKSHVQEALDYFGINKKVENILIMTNDQEERKGKKAVRIVTAAFFEDGEKLIVRFLNEREFILDVTHLKVTTQIIENQSIFSEVLRKEGMIVPRKYSKNGSYCMPWNLDGIPLDVTVEEYLGKPLEKFSPELFGQYGCMIGQLHSISLAHHCWTDFSIVFEEVKENRTDFRKLFHGLDMGNISEELLDDVAKYHDIRKQEVVEIWTDLPRSAVQGDLYSCNNVAMTERGIGFYDFNVAADEVLLGDMLHVWFRTIYDVNNEDQINTWDIEKCWNDYLNGYEQFRKWTEQEQKALAKVYVLLGSIYIGRYAAELIRQKRYDDAERQLRQALVQLKTEERTQE